MIILFYPIVVLQVAHPPTQIELCEKTGEKEKSTYTIIEYTKYIDLFVHISNAKQSVSLTIKPCSNNMRLVAISHQLFNYWFLIFFTRSKVSISIYRWNTTVSKEILTHARREKKKNVVLQSQYCGPYKLRIKIGVDFFSLSQFVLVIVLLSLVIQ